MDIEKLKQLAKLKDKGLLNQDEFDREKRKILNQDELENKESKKENNLIAVGVFILLLTLLIAVPNIAFLLFLITSIILAMLSYKYKMSRYDKWYCAGPFRIIICCFFVGPIMIPLFIYGLLEIQDDNIPLKSEKI